MEKLSSALPLLAVILLIHNASSTENSTDDSEDLLANYEYLRSIMYGVPNKETGKKVAEWNPEMEVNPEELGEYAEGDILNTNGILRSGLRDVSRRWPGGVVPYTIVTNDFTKEQRETIFNAMRDYHAYTCIRFKPYTGKEKDYIRISASSTGCWSSIGRIGGRQEVNYQVPNCLNRKGTAIHELMHALGFFHEHSRYDRDNYVAIQWSNVEPGQENNFEKAIKGRTTTFNTTYDYGSVMHYSAGAFSRNKKPTIIAKRKYGGYMGQRVGFSKNDIQQIRRMYNCGTRKRRSIVK